MIESGQIGPCSPLFIVTDIGRSVRHYVDALGFECTYQGPQEDVFLAIVTRDTAQIMLKVIGQDTKPVPNQSLHPWACFDAFIFVSDPDALAREFRARNVFFHRSLGTEDDGLRGFEIADPDGYVCYFGRPAS